MNFHQIHIGKKPNADRIKCMKSVIGKVTSEDTYTLVSSTNFFNKLNDVKWIDVETVKNQMFSEYPYIKKIWSRFNVKNQSDFIRMFLASKVDDFVYFDTDVVLGSRPEFLIQGRPYFSHSTSTSFCADFHAIYNNNDFGFFKKFLNQLIFVLEHDKAHEITTEVNILYMWIFLRNFVRENGYNKLDHNIYQHLTGKI